MAKCISKLHLALGTQKVPANFGPKCIRLSLAAGLCPDPLGELEHSPDPLAAIGGCLLLKGREGEKGRKG